MTINRQLTLSIIAIMLLSFIGTFIISTHMARAYLQQQLQVKNIDNATALAISITQSSKNPVDLDLLLSAQFDSGHYRSIRLLDAHEHTVFERQNDAPIENVPGWFVNLIPIQVRTGQAQIQDGWNLFGTLRIESSTQYAYQDLWSGSLNLLAMFALMTLLATLAGNLLFKIILKPLDQVVLQARAVQSHRFVSQKEPATPEIRQVVRAINALVEYVKTTIDDSKTKIEDLRKQLTLDPLTHLNNRDEFMKGLDQSLNSDDRRNSGTIAIIRLGHLIELNRSLGRAPVDAWLKALANSLSAYARQQPNHSQVGRISATDFALLSADIHDTETLKRDLQRLITALIKDETVQSTLRIAIGISSYHTPQTKAQVLTQTDGAVAEAEQYNQALNIRIAQTQSPSLAHLTDQKQWQRALEQGLAQQRIRLGRYPVITASGTVLHYEAPVRMQINGQWLSAAHFISWAARLNLLDAIDKAVIKTAVRDIQATQSNLSITLGAQSLDDLATLHVIKTSLGTDKDAAKRLWINIPEHAVQQRLDKLKHFIDQTRPMGCKLGLQHAGHLFASIEKLQELGLDFIKLAPSITDNISADPARIAYLQNLCNITKVLNIQTIAVGITDAQQQQPLKDLGINAFTGSAVYVKE